MSDTVVPKHIGFIVDGNRRWAKKHGLPAYEGHLAGYNTLKDVARACFDAGVRFLSFYAFSTENWKRTEEEVSRIMNLVVKAISNDLEEFKSKDIKMLVLGSREGLGDKVIRAIERVEDETKDCSGGIMAVCLNYGGQQEIVEAVKKIVQSGVGQEEITDKTIAENLYGPEVPPIDIMVRTSGEQRISNFMLWRIAYAEMMFIEKNWPEMTKRDVTNIIKEYNKRQRRFGG